MLWLLTFFLLFVAWTFFAYQFSSARKMKKRMQEVLSPFENLDTELRRLRQEIQNAVESSSSQYVQGIHAARLKAIPLGESKKYATGMRLHALKDAGFRTVADLQGWNEYRISQVRGVGPKSASAIVQAVARITTATRAIPIDHPIPPFSRDIEHQYMQALYRQHWFDTHISEQGRAFARDLAIHQTTRDEVAAKINFSRWLWKFGSNETIRYDIAQAEAALENLEGNASRSMLERFSTSLAKCRAVCANPVPANQSSAIFMRAGSSTIPG